MTYRGMTEIELYALVHELRAFETWREYVRFARDIYGPAAERVEVIAAAEHGGALAYRAIEAVHVYDARRRPLDPYLATEWWGMMLYDQFAFGDLGDGGGFEDVLGEIIGERRAALPVPASSFEIFLASRPPRRHYKRVFVEAAERQAAA